MKQLTALSLALAAIVILPGSVLAEAPEMTEAFVCPVIESQSLANNPQAKQLPDGNYTVVPETANNGDLYVPVHATNDDGQGKPGDSAAPGDTTYTAIWARQ